MACFGGYIETVVKPRHILLRLGTSELIFEPRSQLEFEKALADLNRRGRFESSWYRFE
jgi:hypothetical protein